MRKKNKKMSNVVVKFYPCEEKEVLSYISSLGLEGTRVSNLINRWAIDVPFWKENYFAKKFLENEDLVERVYLMPYNNFSKIEEN